MILALLACVNHVTVVSVYWPAIGESALVVDPASSVRGFRMQVNAEGERPNQYLEAGVTDCDFDNLEPSDHIWLLIELQKY